METLYKKHKILISQVSTEIIREMMDAINWESKLVAIRGSRGVGKTTLMRQYIRQKYGTSAGKALYCAMDSLYFSNHSLLDLAENFHLSGGRHLFLDEVHKYPTWSKEIKEINDLYADMKVCFTGSSLLQIINADADLSRFRSGSICVFITISNFRHIRYRTFWTMPTIFAPMFARYAARCRFSTLICGRVIILFMTETRWNITAALRMSLVSLSTRN